MAIAAGFAIWLLFSGIAWAVDRSPDAEMIDLVNRHCLECHGKQPEISGEVDLRNLDASRLQSDVELTHQLIQVLDEEAMPPEDQPVLDARARELMVARLRTLLQQGAAKQPSASYESLRRMNRFQYNNAVIDLLQLRCIVFTLPERMLREHRAYFNPDAGKMPDVVTVGSRPLGKSQMIEARLAGVAAFPQDLRAEHGFDNQIDHLSMSPLLMESFLRLGQSIVTSPDFGPKTVGRWETLFAPPTEAATQPMQQLITTRIESLLLQAFRRVPSDQQVQRYARYALDQINAGRSFTDAMKETVAAVLASPNFLYIYGTPAAEQQPFELASRLSFFLWGSIPDEALLQRAIEGRLNDPKVLAIEVERMLRDRKLKRFCDSFPAQWLQLERIISSVPNREKFPEFYFSKYRKSMHMMAEPLLLFETVLIEDLPITQLIDSDFTYRSSLLEDAYGELQTKASKTRAKRGEVGLMTFHRTPVTDRRNGGVITTAATMTMTSGPLETKPITRGAWIAGVIFNNPPEPPPADVPPLSPKPPPGEEHLTLRQRLSLHRSRSDCRGCHEAIDPLGFALENYDPVGRWRQGYENQSQVDASGKLFNRHAFADVVEFKSALLLEKDRFTRGLAGHLLSFALARPLTAVDSIAIEQIANQCAADGYAMQSLIKHVVLSEPFRTTSESLTVEP